MSDRDDQRHARPTDPAAVPDVTHPDTSTRVKAIAVEIRDSPAEARDELLFVRMVAAWPTLEAQSN